MKILWLISLSLLCVKGLDNCSNSYFVNNVETIYSPATLELNGCIFFDTLTSSTPICKYC